MSSACRTSTHANPLMENHYYNLIKHTKKRQTFKNVKICLNRSQVLSSHKLK